MTRGTKSILFGVHQFMIHPVILFIAWWQLYGFPWDPRLWVAFVVHDLGYWGCADMDGDEGEKHVYFGARVMSTLFSRRNRWMNKVWGCSFPEWYRKHDRWQSWWRFCVNHSRFMATQNNAPVSPLCVADKLVFVIEPWWLYLPRAWLSGELAEYMAAARVKYAGSGILNDSPMQWHRSTREYLKQWVAAHKDGVEDTWTRQLGGTDRKEPENE